jgi:hypothetical protein
MKLPLHSLFVLEGWKYPLYHLSLGAFAVSELDVVFLGYQLR